VATVFHNEIGPRVHGADTLTLRDYLYRQPGAPSYGQRQPAAFVMDEPLSNLDAALRTKLHAEIASGSRQIATTTIYATHDQTEAMALGHRVAVFRHGVLQQVASPQQLYDRPDNLFVAGFIGSPAMNFVRGVFCQIEDLDGSHPHLVVGRQQLPVPPKVLRQRPGLAAYVGRPVAVGIRPEHLSEVTSRPPTGTATLYVEAELVEAVGSEVIVHLGLNADPVVADGVGGLSGDSVTRDLASVDTKPPGTELVARFSHRSQVRAGGTIQVAVDVERLHLFDLRRAQPYGDAPRTQICRLWAVP
jgi:multiple sugar transport system ATP-binding protein